MKNKKNLVFACLAGLFEILSFYFFKYVLLNYFSSETAVDLTYDSTDWIYGGFTIAIAVSGVVGAFLGDFFVANKRVSIIGAILQTIGVLLMCIPVVSLPLIYSSFALVCLGKGFFYPNFISNIAKSNLAAPKFIVVVLLIDLCFIDLGSFISTFATGFFTEDNQLIYGFLLGGIFSIISIFLLLKTRDFPEAKPVYLESSNKLIPIGFVFLIHAVFWSSWHLFYNQLYDMARELTMHRFDDNFIIDPILLTSVVAIFIPIVLIFVWSFYHQRSFIKFVIGFVLMIIGSLITFYFSIVGVQFLGAVVSALIIITIAEIFIFPETIAALAKFGNPKYLAILISLTSILSLLFNFMYDLIDKQFDVESKIISYVSLFTLNATLLAVILFIVFSKRMNLSMKG